MSIDIGALMLSLFGQRRPRKTITFKPVNPDALRDPTGGVLKPPFGHVGRDGPEVFVPRTGEVIIPNGRDLGGGRVIVTQPTPPIHEVSTWEHPPNPDAVVTSYADGFPAEFTYRELIASDIAARHGIDNTPPPNVLQNMRRSAKGLVRVKQALGGLPVYVTSGYRCPRLNALVGSSPGSAHIDGWAYDIKCPAFGTPSKVAWAISMLDLMDELDQLILEFDGWVHVSFDPRNRAEVLTINKHGVRKGIH